MSKTENLKALLNDHNLNIHQKADALKELYFLLNRVETLERNQKEILDSLKNMVGHFDTPIARRKMFDEKYNEVRKEARNTLEKYS